MVLQYRSPALVPRVPPPAALGTAGLVNKPGLEAQSLEVSLQDRCREWDGIQERGRSTVGRRTSGVTIPTSSSPTPSCLQPMSSYSGLTRKASDRRWLSSVALPSKCVFPTFILPSVHYSLGFHYSLLVILVYRGFTPTSGYETGTAVAFYPPTTFTYILQSSRKCYILYSASYTTMSISSQSKSTTRTRWAG